MIRRRMLIVTGGAAIYPLLVLFGLNAVDELDRTAFAVLLPNIRDAFGLNLQGVLTLIAAVSVGALLLQVPIASLSDRSNRVRITWIGALGHQLGGDAGPDDESYQLCGFHRGCHESPRPLVETEELLVEHRGERREADQRDRKERQ